METHYKHLCVLLFLRQGYPLPRHELASLWRCAPPGLSGDRLWQRWWEYAPLLPSSVIICDRLYGQPRLVTQPHTGLLSLIWLISILYNALLPAATVNERIVTHSLNGVNQRQDRERVNAQRQTGWHLRKCCCCRGDLFSVLLLYCYVAVFYTWIINRKLIESVESMCHRWTKEMNKF